MSMFGLLYTGLVIICKGIVGVENTVNDYKSKSDAANRGKLCYYDHRGAYRLVSNNQQVYHTTLSNGERVLKNNGGQIVHNFDHDKRMEALNKYNQELKENNNQVIALGTFEDLYPELMHTGIYVFLSDKTMIYKYLPNGKKYLRKKSFFQTGYDLFIDFDTGQYTALNQKIDERNQQWINEQNAMKNKIGIHKITLKQIDSFVGV